MSEEKKKYYKFKHDNYQPSNYLERVECSKEEYEKSEAERTAKTKAYYDQFETIKCPYADVDTTTEKYKKANEGRILLNKHVRECDICYADVECEHCGSTYESDKVCGWELDPEIMAAIDSLTVLERMKLKEDDMKDQLRRIGLGVKLR